MTILHLEDSVEDAMIVEALLREEWPDCQIRRVASRSEFESALRLESFDLILSDHQIPGYDGLRALEETRLRRPDRPFIFLSGTIGEERAVEAMRNGADDYVLKDRPARLVSSVRQAMTRLEDAERRRAAEEALRQSQEIFRQITENVADMIAVLDVHGRRVYNNPTYRGILGDPSTLKGTDSFFEIHPDDRERVHAVFRETVLTGIGQRLEYRFLLANGAIRYIESQGSVIRGPNGEVVNVLVVSRDVTERREAEMQLREQASLLDKARDAIIAVDLEHRISYWNASAERMYGWTDTEVFGRDLRTLGLGYDPARFETAWTETLAHGEWRGQFQLKSRRNAPVPVATTWSLVLNREGRPRTLLLIDSDLTEEKKLQSQLQRAHRLESIGTLTGGIAHDLNNVLTPILMAVELLQAYELPGTAAKAVGAIDSSATHGAALVRQLLGFARGTEGERAVISSDKFVHELHVMLRQMLPQRVKLETAFARDLWPISADVTQLKQVMLNLCINACDAMSRNGTIVLGAKNTDVGEKLARTMLDASPGPHLQLSVSDTGTGIPPEILEKIFDPFFTTKEIGKGTGLGLSMVQGILKGHRGIVQVESTVGVGTTFHIFLPAVEKSPSPAAEPALPQGAGETVLVINDGSGGRDLLRPFLEHHRYRVIVARDGAEGLSRLRAQSKEIDAVVIEMVMSAALKLELIRALHELKPALPVIAVVEAAEDSPQIAGACTTLRKPAEPRQLLSALSQALRPAVSP